MSVIGSNVLAGASGAAGGGGKVYVDDVFSTFLIEGNSSSGRAINNGIDLAGEGGLVWTKQRDGTRSHYLFDTENFGYALSSDLASSKVSASNRLTAFNNNGFTLGSDSDVNQTSSSYASWTFRKAPGFFDIVTYSGNDTARAIPHNLGSVPGMIIVKKLNDSGGWYTYHRSTGNTKWFDLKSPNDASTVNLWNNQTPTASEFYLSSNTNPNGTGYQYVAYIFAHDEPVFGTDEDESIIKCGMMTGQGDYNLGFEPQFLLTKPDDNNTDWYITDNMRGDGDEGITGANVLGPNTSAAEVASQLGISFNSTGFKNFNYNQNVIYMAIRRPNKPPTAATEVFAATNPTSSGTYTVTAGFPVDSIFYGNITTSDKWYWADRLRKSKLLRPNTSDSESSVTTGFDSNTKFVLPTVSGDYSGQIAYCLKRTTGAFDVISYDGTGSNFTSINHGLGVVPEMFWIKRRTGSSSWAIYHKDVGAAYSLTFSDADPSPGDIWQDTGVPTSTQFFTHNRAQTNFAGNSYVGYFFATLPGISKVGSYSGNTGYAVNVPCGFTNGARFILIKRTDIVSTGDWYVWDTVRGIASGNDPYLLLNSTAAEVTNTDYIDPNVYGFTVTSSAPAALNVTGGTYLFLAIA